MSRKEMQAQNNNNEDVGAPKEIPEDATRHDEHEIAAQLMKQTGTSQVVVKEKN